MFATIDTPTCLHSFKLNNLLPYIFELLKHRMKRRSIADLVHASNGENKTCI